MSIFNFNIRKHFRKIAFCVCILSATFGIGISEIALSQTWAPIKSQTGPTGTWQALSSSSTSTLTWQALGVTTYTCPAGYTLTGQNCSITTLTSATPSYYCSTGSLSGSNCISSYLATNVGYSCLGPCYTVPGSYPADTIYQCPTMYGTNQCLPNNDVTNPHCPSGGNLSNGICYASFDYGMVVSSYTCKNGGVYDTMSLSCKVTSPASISGYSCAAGVLVGSQCSNTTTIPATAN